MAKVKDVKTEVKDIVTKEEGVTETFQEAMKKSMSVLPNLSTISSRLEGALALTKDGEEKIRKFLLDEEDKAFTLSAYLASTKSATLLMDSARKYLDSLSRMWGLGLAPVPEEDRGLFDPMALTDATTEEELEASRQNSMFGRGKRTAE
jgi:hypothetical protein